MLTKLIAKLSAKRVEHASQAYVDSIEAVVNHTLQHIPKHLGEVTAVMLKHRKEIEQALEILKPLREDLKPVWAQWQKDMNKAGKHNARSFEVLANAWSRIFK